MDILEVLRDMGIGAGKKLEGDALASHVRLGKTFMNAAGKLIGTLVVRATGTTAITPGTTAQTLTAGIYDGDITIAGDADLIAANLKAGVNVFGVVGKTEVIDTTEATVPATAAQVRSGRKAFINGALLTGTLAIQSTVAVTVTPSTADQVKAAGIYDLPITVVGDVDLATGNIRAGVNLFGVAGKAQVVDTTEASLPVAVADMLAGKVGFVNGAKVVGGMVNRAGTTNGPYSAYPYGGGLRVLPYAGAYDALSSFVQMDDPTFIAASILSGKTVFALAGAAPNVYTNAATPSGGYDGDYWVQP
jgi:hypothetical protein